MKFKTPRSSNTLRRFFILVTKGTILQIIHQNLLLNHHDKYRVILVLQ